MSDVKDANTTPAESEAAVTKKALNRGKKAIDKKNNVLGKLEIQYVKIGDVKPNDYNPNRQSEHDFELLVMSMTEDGFTQPIVSLKDGTIVDGEHRWRAARSLGYDTIPVVFVDMSPEQMKIATLRHNRARGSEDVELTAQVLKDLQELGAIDWAQDSLLMDDAELNKMLEDISAPEALAGEDWNESWMPTKGKEGGKSDEVMQYETSGKTGLSAGSTDAADAMRQRETNLKGAKSEEERQSIMNDTKIMSITLTFKQEQGDFVMSVLGKKPAERLLQILQAITHGAEDVQVAVDALLTINQNAQ